MNIIESRSRNDTPYRTKEEVLDLFNRALEVS